MTASHRVMQIEKLASALEDGLFERQHAVRLCLLAALAGESVFLLGPPGIGKSLIARRLKSAFQQASTFEYLMTRFSTPEELFGPLSIKALKDQGRYQRLTQGYLPQAQVVFLDEIWKAGPAILNTLLTAVNERRFRNGDCEEMLPLRLLVTASNELPEPDSGLDALYDRMLIRLSLDNIQQKAAFYAMLTHPSQPITLADDVAISDQQYQQWQTQIEHIRLPTPVFELLFTLRQQWTTVISDRRWKKALRLLKACAFFSGREAVCPLDLALLQDCLWQTPEEIPVLQQQLAHLLTSHGWQQQHMLSQIDQLARQQTQHSQQQAGQAALVLTASASRLFRRPRYQLPASLNASRLTLWLEKPLILHDQKTLQLQIDRTALAGWLKHGGDIRGQLNGIGFAQPLDLQVTKQGDLQIRDISLQASRLLLQNLPAAPLSPETQQQLADITRQWQHQHQQFSQQQTCPFIGESWLALIETSFQQIQTRLQQVRHVDP